jgi:hypothetical protein
LQQQVHRELVHRDASGGKLDVFRHAVCFAI